MAFFLKSGQKLDPTPITKEQFTRAEKLQDRAEAIQEISAKMMGVARKSMIIILPIVFMLVIYLTWIILR